VRVLRDHEGAAPAVTTMELFFDLVYVFAITQLSHALLHDLTWRGALETLVLFLAVWWSWNYTAWATNWIDPDRTPVRLLLLVLMLISLIMSAAIPQAFGGRGLAFAAAYVASHLVRGGFMVAAFRDGPMRRNYAQLTAWTAIAGVFWIAGACVHGNARLLLWVIGLAIDYGAPLHGFWLPGLGSTPLTDWTLRGAHLAERCQLVVLIALGETILAVGQTFGELAWTTSTALAFGVGFAGAVSLWWIYFVQHAEAGVEAIEHSADPARLGRAGYAYAHGVMVGGVLVVAVAIDLTIGRPTGPTPAATAWVILAGPALYLAGNALFGFTLTRRTPWSRLLGIAALALLAPLALAVSPLVLSALAALVTIALALAGSRQARLQSAAARTP
jgi:low temperature requirement protein LtrA